MSELYFVFSFFTALALSLILVPALIRISLIYEWFDKPNQPENAADSEAWRKIHTKAVPVVGGVAIVLGFLIPFSVFATPKTYTFLVSVSFVIFLVGFVDDFKNLPPFFRMIVQTICAGLVVWHSDLVLDYVYLGNGFGFKIPYYLGFVVSVFIIAGSINSTNMSDGLDGLAAGLSVICMLFISFIHYICTEDLTLIVSLTLPMIGATLGFLRYNTHPASIFMGDSGSNWLGFMIGVLYLKLLTGPIVTSIGTTQINLPLVAVLMGSAIPIIDTASVLFFRFCQGKPLASADKSHFHHSLLKIGLTHAQSVMTIYFLALIASIAGIVTVAYPPPKYDLWYVPYCAILGCVVVISGTRLIAEKGLSRERALTYFETEFSLIGKRLRATIRLWETLNKYIVYLLLAVLPAFAASENKGIGLYALGAFVIVFISTIWGSKRKSDFLDSAILVIGVGVLLFAANQSPLRIMWLGQELSIQGLYNTLFYFLFISSILFILVTMRRKYLVFTPSDFLLASVPLILLLAPEPYRSTYRLPGISIRCLIFFMVLRTFAKRRQRSIYNVKIIVILSLIYVIIANLFGFKVL